jgi:flavin reductase (DIM6/NTAB) family NADH-FMN oxidoreductase RutF
MVIDLSELSPNSVYFTLIQTIIPRPVAWVLSQNDDDSLNLAPFSYFTPICSDPPLVLFSVGRKPDGSHKDTRVNIEARKDFVINIPSLGQALDVTESSRTLAYGESELDRVSAELTEFEGCTMPRMANSPIALYCERHEIQEIGYGPQSLIIARVKQVYVDDGCLNEGGRFSVNPSAVNPLARLGADQYASLGEVITVARPK